MFDTEDLLKSLRYLRESGFLAFYQEPLEGALDTIFFEEIPDDLKKLRKQQVKEKLDSGLWYLVTQEFHGREWVEDMLYYCGCFAIEVENSEEIRQELLRIRPLADKV